MNLEDLRVFCAVAQHQSFSAAASLIRIPAATVSRRIAALEQSLGSKLLHRTTRSVQLSDTGLALLQRAAPLLEEFTALEQDTLTRQNQARGTLRLQIPLELFADDLLNCLHGFQQSYPEIDLVCAQYLGSNHRPPEDFDLTLICYEVGLPDSDWIATPLVSLAQGIYGSPQLALQQTLAPGALADLPLIARCDQTLWHFRYQNVIESVKIKSRLRLDSLTAQIQAASKGLGLIKAPKGAVEKLVQESQLLPVATTLPPVALSVSLYYRGRVQPLRVKVFMDYLQQYLGGGTT